MASNLIALAAMASNLMAMASNLLAMASNNKKTICIYINQEKHTLCVPQASASES